jgi:hypothetical protein
MKLVSDVREAHGYGVVRTGRGIAAFDPACRFQPHHSAGAPLRRSIDMAIPVTAG